MKKMLKWSTLAGVSAFSLATVFAESSTQRSSTATSSGAAAPAGTPRVGGSYDKDSTSMPINTAPPSSSATGGTSASSAPSTVTHNRKDHEHNDAMNSANAMKPSAAQTAVQNALTRDSTISSAASQITVTTKDQKVVLLGTVATQAEKDRIESRARQAAGGAQIESQITVESQGAINQSPVNDYNTMRGSGSPSPSGGATSSSRSDQPASSDRYPANP